MHDSQNPTALRSAIKLAPERQRMIVVRTSGKSWNNLLNSVSSIVMPRSILGADAGNVGVDQDLCDISYKFDVEPIGMSRWKGRQGFEYNQGATFGEKPNPDAISSLQGFYLKPGIRVPFLITLYDLFQ